MTTVRRDLEQHATTDAVVGTGAVASIGSGTDDVFEAACRGTSGVAPLRRFDPARYRAQAAYEIDDRADGAHDCPARATSWLLTAVSQALDEARMGTDLTDIPVVVGTGLRELRSVELRWRDGTDFDLTRLHFGTALRERFGATRTYTVSNACSAALYALAMGSDLLRLGVADSVVVAGVDSVTESMFGLLDRVQLTAPSSVRPFDRDRRGVLMGEGATAIVLERDADRAVHRVVGRIRSTSVGCDAHHMTAPDVDGIARVMREAHARAGVTARDIDVVFLHGTGTRLNDEAEAAALRDVFGGDVAAPLMTAVKSMTGHTSGGSGLLSLVLALRSLTTGRVPPVLGLHEATESASDFRFVRGSEEHDDLRCAQINAFGFGGINAVSIIDRPTNGRS